MHICLQPFVEQLVDRVEARRHPPTSAAIGVGRYRFR
jgi:hypothetical protein